MMALLKRAGNSARGKTAGKRARSMTELRTKAGTTAEVQGEVVGSLSQVLGMGLIAFQTGSRMTSHPIASSGEPGGGGGGAEDVERCTLIHPPSYTESYHRGRWE